MSHPWSTIAVSLSLLAAAPVTAEDRPWVARLQLGGATIHEWEDARRWAEVRIGRRFAEGLLSIDVGLSGSRSGDGYAGLTLGLELLPLPRAVVSPYARVEVGGLYEPEEGVVGTTGVGGGLVVRLDDLLHLRGGASLAVHEGHRGPVVIAGGVELRW